MSRVRLAFGVAIVLVLGAVLLYLLVRDMSGDAAGDQSAAISEPPSVESPAPSPTSDPEELESEEPIEVPTPDTTGRDFEKILIEVVTFRDWLFRHPDPSLVRLIFHRECECYEQTSSALETLQANGAYIEGPSTVVHSAEVTEDFPSLFRLTVVLQTPEQSVIDSDGETVSSRPASDPAEYSVAFVLSRDRWIVRSMTRTG